MGGELGVEDHQRRLRSRHRLVVVAESEDLSGLIGLQQVGVGVDQGVRDGVLGEEGEHRGGALGAAGDVVLFEDRVLPVVHDGVEVQVEVRPLGDAPRRHGAPERPEQSRLHAVVAAVGVVGQGGGLGDRAQAGEQPRRRIGRQVVDVGDPAQGAQLERQQRQDRRLVPG